MELAALELLLRAALALPHAVGDLERVLEHLEPLGRGRPGEPEAIRFGLVPAGADAEPGPAAGEDVEGRRGLDPQPRGAVGGAADHQPEAGPLAVGGHEAERRPALEHRLELGARRADLPEVIHHPDRVEADVVGGPHGAGEGRSDRLRAAGPGERVDLQVRASRCRSFRAAPGGRGPIEGLDLGWGRARRRVRRRCRSPGGRSWRPGWAGRARSR